MTEENLVQNEIAGKLRDLLNKYKSDGYAVEFSAALAPITAYVAAKGWIDLDRYFDHVRTQRYLFEKLKETGDGLP